ncbi:MAG: hypothetical protein MJ090_00650 [Clostridia bacterium]|nr:hypothetical protein [Clostridia bacterium]
MSIFKKKNKNDSLLRTFDGRQVKYVTKKVSNADGSPCYVIVGKSGRIAVIDNQIRVICGETDVFNCCVDTAKYYLLLSGDGVTVEGNNTVSGKYETITAYYSYYRK